MDGSTGFLAKIAGGAVIVAAMLIPTSQDVTGAATISGDNPWSPSSIDKGCVVKYMPETTMLLEQCTSGKRSAIEVRDPNVQEHLRIAQDNATGDHPLPDYPGKVTQGIPGFTSSIDGVRLNDVASPDAVGDN